MNIKSILNEIFHWFVIFVFCLSLGFGIVFAMGLLGILMGVLMRLHLSDNFVVKTILMDWNYFLTIVIVGYLMAVYYRQNFLKNK